MWPKHLLILLLSLAIPFAIADCSQGTDFWTNPGTGDWFTAGNWSNGVVPDLFDVAVINNGGTAVVQGPGGETFGLTLGQTSGTSGFVSLITAILPGELAVGLLDIGLEGTGGATVSQGTTFLASSTVLGSAATGVGTLTVRDFGSLFSAPDVTIGNAGQGSLVIESGGRAFNGPTTLGNMAGSSGTATMSGLTSRWDIEGPLVIGNAGSGEFNFPEGSLTVVEIFGPQQPVLQTITIGTQGVFRLGLGFNFFGGITASEINVNGTLQFNYFTALITHNIPITGTGELVHDGSGSTILTNTDGFTGSITVNAGLLRLDDTSVNLGGNSIRTGSGAFMEYEGADVSHAVLRGSGIHYVVPGATSRFFSVSTLPGSAMVQDGIAEFDNVTLGGTLQSNHVATLDGFWNTSSGKIEVNSDMGVQAFTSDGIITINNGGTLNNSVSNFTAGGGSRTTVAMGGTLNIFGATTMELNGALLVNNGDITGTVNVNYGSLAKGTGNYDIVNVNEGGVYSPGNSPGVGTAAAFTLENGSFASGAPQLVMEIGGTTPGSQYDQLLVSGLLSLDGVLDVLLIDGFTPSAGQSFDILDWGTLTGTFDVLTLPALSGGLNWNTSQLYTSGLLSVSPGFTADFDKDGDVDGDDLAQWEGDYGQNGFSDADGDNDSDGADFLAWQQQFGSGVPPLAASQAVPEPRSVCLAAFAFGVVMATRQCVVPEKTTRTEFCVRNRTHG